MNLNTIFILFLNYTLFNFMYYLMVLLRVSKLYFFDDYLSYTDTNIFYSSFCIMYFCIFPFTSTTVIENYASH